MKSTAVLHRVFIVIFLLLLNLPNLIGQEDKEDDNQEWFRRKFSLKLNNDNTFTNTDTTLSSIKNGNYTLSDQALILSTTRDSVKASEVFPVAEISNKKFSVFKGGERITYLKENKQLQPSLSWNGLFRGLLGMFSLLFIAFLISRNRKAINWKLVGKGILLQIVLALLILLSLIHI